MGGRENRESVGGTEERLGEEFPFDESPSVAEPEERSESPGNGNGSRAFTGPHPDGNGIEDLKIGAILRLAREEAGFSYAEAEAATKIRKRYLEALEMDDYGTLPDPVYVLGFIRAYANFLSLDGERLADEVKRRRARRRDQRQDKYRNLRRGRLERSTVTHGGVSGARRRLVTPATLLTAIVCILLVGAVIGVLYYVGAGSSL